MGLQGLFQETERKGSGQKENHQTLMAPPSHRDAPSPTWSNLANSFLPPPGEGLWPTPHPTPRRALYAPDQPAGILEAPSFPTNQQVNRRILRPPLPLGYKTRQDPVLSVSTS